MSFPMISIGDVVRELATKDGLELTRDNLHATSKKYMGEFGQTFFPEMIVKKIKESDAPNLPCFRHPSALGHRDFPQGFRR